MAEPKSAKEGFPGRGRSPWNGAPPGEALNKRAPRNNKSRYRKSLIKLSNNYIDAKSYITNLSSKNLTAMQEGVLALGLTFVPSSRVNKDKLNKDIDNFERSNRLKFYFSNSPPSEPHPFRQKSNWIPPPASSRIETYLKRVREQVTQLKPTKMHYNLTREEQKVLRELASDHSLVIKAADKGSGIVVEDTTSYVKDGLEHLSDHSIYERIESDPTEPLTTEIEKFVSQMHKRGIIDETTKKYLTTQQDKGIRTQQLYFLKKIHKNPIAVRPIVSGCGGPTERLSQFIDMHLQPLVPKAKSFIKDSGDLVNLLERTTIPTNSILATIDVKALYLNIPNQEGIQAVLNRLYYNNAESDLVPIPPETMSDLLNIVLSHNYFQFADGMYHQIQGTAMGTKMAPAYANLFMAELEERLLEDYTVKPIMWERFIDDILCIWPGTQESLARFMEYLNRAHPTIKFTFEHSTTMVDFLDITIYKGPRYRATGMLDVKPFFKKTNKFQYLQYTSAHPTQTFSSLIKGELTRLLRVCSDEQEYDKVQQKMQETFTDRGYPKSLIRKIQQKVPFSKRQTLLSKTKPPCPYDTFLVTEFTTDLDVKTLKSTLKLRPEEEDFVPKPCLSLKKTKNFRKILVKAKLREFDDPVKSTTPIKIPLTPNLKGHSAGCNTHGCKCCRVMSRKVRVISSSTHISYPVPSHSNCGTASVIYLLECKKCHKAAQYVGQTKRTLSQRIAGHRQASTLKTHLPLYKHFAGSRDHNFERDIIITILEKTTQEKLNDREGHWIKTLDTVVPKGLNSRFE